MSFVQANPEALASAAGTLQGIGSAMSSQNAAAAAPTTGVVPAAVVHASVGVAGTLTTFNLVLAAGSGCTSDGLRTLTSGGAFLGGAGALSAACKVPAPTANAPNCRRETSLARRANSFKS